MAVRRKPDSVRSMTGFGRSALARGAFSIEVEVRSVNHRHLDLTLRLPKQYNAFEADIRSVVGDTMQRGRVEVSVMRSTSGVQRGRVVFNRELCDSLVRIYEAEFQRRKISNENLKAEIVRDVLSRREVLDIAEDSQEGLAERPLLLRAVKDAVQACHGMRAAEGRRLVRDIVGRIKILERVANALEKGASTAAEEQRARLRQRIVQAAGDAALDVARLTTEIALQADRLDVTEEVVRLKSHLHALRSCFDSMEPVGRRLDFLVQEVHRELNTIGSKIQNAVMQHLVVDAKSEVERIREQIQNIE